MKQEERNHKIKHQTSELESQIVTHVLCRVHILKYSHYFQYVKYK